MHQNLQINWCSYIHLNEPALNAESLLEEVEREKDKSSRCSRDSIQFRPTAAGFHKNAIFNLVSLCILKYARPYHCHLCYVTPRPTELMDPVMICNKNPSSSHSQLVLQTINRRSCTITEKAPTRAFSWLNIESAYLLALTHLRHY